MARKVTSNTLRRPVARQKDPQAIETYHMPRCSSTFTLIMNVAPRAWRQRSLANGTHWALPPPAVTGVCNKKRQFGASRAVHLILSTNSGAGQQSRQNIGLPRLEPPRRSKLHIHGIFSGRH